MKLYDCIFMYCSNTTIIFSRETLVIFTRMLYHCKVYILVAECGYLFTIRTKEANKKLTFIGTGKVNLTISMLYYMLFIVIE